MEISDDMAIDFIKDVRNNEEAEFLAFRILRNLSDPYKVFEKIKCEKELTPTSLYCLQMFKRNLEV